MFSLQPRACACVRVCVCACACACAVVRVRRLTGCFDVTQEDMVKLEKAFLDHDEYKFGVLYGKEGQSENEMFANGKCHAPSRDTHTHAPPHTHVRPQTVTRTHSRLTICCAE